MLARLRVLALLVTVAVTAPALAHAQQSTSARVTRSAGPRLELTATAARQRPHAVDSAAAATMAARRKNMGQPVALMVVGGAAFILGAVIGGDAGTIFMIGGAVTGLIGLYQYLQ